MLRRLEEFLGAHGAHYELIAHKEAVMLPACCAIDMNRLKGLIGLELASIDEIHQRDIAMPAGDHRSAIRMRATEYLRLAEPRRGQFAVHEGATFPVHPRPRTRAGKPSDDPTRDRGGAARRGRA